MVAHTAFRQGDRTTNFVAEHFSEWQKNTEPVPEMALVTAAIADMLADNSRVVAADGAAADADAFSPWATLRGFRLGVAQ